MRPCLRIDRLYTPWGTAYISEWLFPQRIRRECVQINPGEHSHRDWVPVRAKLRLLGRVDGCHVVWCGRGMQMTVFGSDAQWPRGERITQDKRTKQIWSKASSHGVLSRNARLVAEKLGTLEPWNLETLTRTNSTDPRFTSPFPSRFHGLAPYMVQRSRALGSNHASLIL